MCLQAYRAANQRRRPFSSRLTLCRPCLLARDKPLNSTRVGAVDDSVALTHSDLDPSPLPAGAAEFIELENARGRADTLLRATCNSSRSIGGAAGAVLASTQVSVGALGQRVAQPQAPAAADCLRARMFAELIDSGGAL